MTQVRSQLRSARLAFRSARYPGDLAAELLPRPSALSRVFTNRRWMLFGGVGASAAAAALLLSLLLTRAAQVTPTLPAGPDRGALVDWLPIAPEKMPLPHFQAPRLPLSAPDLRLHLQVPPGVEAYQDLAMQYRELQLPDAIRHPTVPAIPADLPTRGVEWLQKVWTGDKSA
jgi:hypothetical protein